MPIYEYVCEKCGDESEAIQKMSDEPLTECAACGASALVKKISRSSFVLKGTGWYATDYKAKPAGGKGDDGDTTSPSKDGGGSSSSSTESAGSAGAPDSGKAPATSPS